jgi:hypothetical protein
MQERSILNLNASDVYEKELTVDEIRADTDDLLLKVTQWLDEAQGDVFTGKHSKVYLVIEVS